MWISYPQVYFYCKYLLYTIRSISWPLVHCKSVEASKNKFSSAVIIIVLKVYKIRIYGQSLVFKRIKIIRKFCWFYVSKTQERILDKKNAIPDRKKSIKINKT